PRPHILGLGPLDGERTERNDDRQQAAQAHARMIPQGRRSLFCTKSSGRRCLLMKFNGMHWMLPAAMVAGVGCNREEPVAEQTQSATQPAERQDDAWITTSLQGRFYADDA